MKNLFSGRLLKCVKCGFTMQSNWNFQSMWTAVEIDEQLLDFCPHCWGIPRHLWPKETIEAYDAFIAGKSSSKAQKEE